MQLKAEQLGFYYKKNKWIFRQLTFSLNHGEVVGVTAPSGTGKTTFARILAGYEYAKEGKVLLDGKAIQTNSYYPVQLIHQHPERSVNPKWKMEQILKEGWDPSEEWFDLMGIQHKWLKRYPNELSGGELQRFCVLRALGPQTQFLIADEMTAMLDTVTQVQIWDALLRIAKERGIGLLVISHEIALMKRVCDRMEQLQM
ncbi:ABC transporter ATP-binding protein [Halalkalibacter sp. APA_J-10(15)]|uniref:ABC transporter ATP-binding protein n=1 Tax=unclassified Halalkalibacter TaxID=2893063 RepID=UPI001FF68EB9|nr:ATP-binding cassette domain-containing protein [Halalkalibacter sp. APA_J-10(15)]MCK0472387.1 ATP-binding cassette domain-containing protein [Halalkalibacter sp. APA_J-10(15)]